MNSYRIKTIIKVIIPKGIRKFLSKYSLKKNIYKILLFLLTYNSITKFLLNKITKKRFETRKFENILNYAAFKPDKVNFLLNFTRDLFYSAPKYDMSIVNDNSLVKIKDKFCYAAVLKDVKIIGGSNLVLLENDKVLYDLKFYDKNKKFQYSDLGIRCYNGDYCLLKINQSNITFDSAIFLAGNFSWNYYHLTYEIFVKFRQIEALKLDVNIPLLVDKICLETPQYKQMLDILNKSNRRVIALEMDKRYVIEQLYYFSCPNLIPPNLIDIKKIFPEDVLFDLQSIEYLRSSLITFAAKTDFPKRIYISRSQASGRRKFNEDDIFAVLEKYGFVTIYPEKYSITQQIALFNNAEFIVGGAGAALTNLLFCQPSCKVIAFTKSKIPFSGFSSIAAAIGVKMLYISDGMSLLEQVDDVHESFVIDPIGFEIILKKFLNSESNLNNTFLN